MDDEPKQNHGFAVPSQVGHGLWQADLHFGTNRLL